MCKCTKAEADKIMRCPDIEGLGLFPNCLSVCLPWFTFSRCGQLTGGKSSSINIVLIERYWEGNRHCVLSLLIA